MDPSKNSQVEFASPAVSTNPSPQHQLLNQVKVADVDDNVRESMESANGKMHMSFGMQNNLQSSGKLKDSQKKQDGLQIEMGRTQSQESLGGFGGGKKSKDADPMLGEIPEADDRQEQTMVGGRDSKALDGRDSSARRSYQQTADGAAGMLDLLKTQLTSIEEEDSRHLTTSRREE